MIVHGLDLSYFTGKLEGYLRLTGRTYRLDLMDTAGFRGLGARTGVRQMPHLSLPDGRLLTDTVTIIDLLEREGSASGGAISLTPADPATSFLAHLVEAFGDEHLWRPALYYRWAFEEDARLAGRRLADTLLRDVRTPAWAKRAYIVWRQRRLYVGGEGSKGAQASIVEADYLALLDALEPVFRKRDWLLGDAPTRADVGLFGPMFRHFLCDPTPGRIMLERAPATAAWVMRLWAGEALQPRSASALRLSPATVMDLAPLITLIVEQFLPELAANAEVCAAAGRTVRWARGGGVFRYRANPYRAWRLDRLSRQFADLIPEERVRLDPILGGAAVRILSAATPGPAVVPEAGAQRDRWWRPL